MSKPSLHRVNLIPAGLVATRQRRRHLRGLMVISVAYLSALFGTCLVVKVASAPAADSPVVELARLTQQEREASMALSRLNIQLQGLSARLDSRKSLADQPDFSELLSLIGNCIDGQASVRELRLQSTGIDPLRPPVNDTPRAVAGSGPPARVVIGAEREPRHFTILLRGVATSETGISRFSARLRELNLFDSVDLKRTGRDLSSSRDAIAFELALILSEPPSPTNVPPGNRSPQ